MTVRRKRDSQRSRVYRAEHALSGPANPRYRETCVRGHALHGPEADVYTSPKGRRQCRACKRQRDQERATAKVEAARLAVVADLEQEYGQGVPIELTAAMVEILTGCFDLSPALRAWVDTLEAGGGVVSISPTLADTALYWTQRLGNAELHRRLACAAETPSTPSASPVPAGCRVCLEGERIKGREVCDSCLEYVDDTSVLKRYAVTGQASKTSTSTDGDWTRGRQLPATTIEAYSHREAVRLAFEAYGRSEEAPKVDGWQVRVDVVELEDVVPPSDPERDALVAGLKDLADELTGEDR